MKDTLVIEFPSAGKTYGPAFGDPDRYGVYSYGVYGSWSVLAGQEKRSCRGEFDTLEEAQHEFPEAEWSGGGCGYREVFIPHTAPSWFDEADAGERWDDDY